MKSGTGLKKETAAALSYVFGFISGFVFLLLEKDPFVRFHAMQSVVTSVIFFVLNILFGITIILSPVSGLLTIAWFILWLIMIYNASQGKIWEAPFFGKYVHQFLGKKK